MPGERLGELQRENMEPPCTSGRSDGKVFRVGCALLPKKVSRYLTSAMHQVAHSRGVELIVLDPTRPLLEQGEFDAIVHKLRPNKEWERHLQEYITLRPNVKVIDSLAGIRIVHNRATMLLPLREHPEGITLQKPYARGMKGGYACARVQSPTQVEIAEGTSLAEAQSLLQRAGLRPPLLMKPLWTDGREGSHGLAVLHDMTALGRVLQGAVCASLKPPLVVQQFVEHGGVLFKVYVLGARTVVCLRPSLGDAFLGQEARLAGVLSLPRISCKSCYAKGSPEDKLSAGVVYDTSTAPAPGFGWQRAQTASAPDLSPQLRHPAAPPDWVTGALSCTLRDKLGLQLFNFDMICPEDQPSPLERLYYVVDINYFPGVDKIPDFEHVFVDFLTAACEGDTDASGDKDAATDPQPDAEMGGGEDNISSVSSEKGDLTRLSGAEAPAPAADAYDRQLSDLR